MRCDAAVEIVTDYLEGALRRVARARLERHLATCPGCSAYLAQMKAVIRLVALL